MSRTITPTAWLRVLRPDPVARHHVLCLPPGGGSATAYRALAEQLGPGYVVAAVQYPGRQDRLADAAIPDIGELADRIAAELLAQPRIEHLSLFGHSMGATVAFETARRLQRDGRPPQLLFVSGRPTPDHREPARLHLGPDDGLIDDLERLAADPGPVRILRNEPGLADLVLPAVRNDYRAVETYAYQPGPALTVDITAFVGTTDPTTSAAQLDRWREFTTGDFTSSQFPGGHFYLDDRPTELAAAIINRLDGQAAHR
ncbi:thioesterase [Nocardia cyriacigeorgica]|uniref:Thioesterase TesA n=1 Tax=Nocardia cyriacigeorgica TaxID=135487 RepID=A0A6P1CXN5_9NOCA|nr:alpha/beta fold hydrolase [Nocardia cyriacigeorgica]NEW37958.1 thioesterase [Nocardia cyriacigeorgica]NEW42866.1 thioesterase [Nocardia cyriacigeorgica]NEW48659.1 thioesterase [Nocardia cyriacigeorgica]